MSENSPYPNRCLNRYPHFVGAVNSGGYGDFLFRNSGHYWKKFCFSMSRLSDLHRCAMV